MSSDSLQNRKGSTHELMLAFQVGEGAPLHGLSPEEKLGSGHCRSTPRSREDFAGPGQVPKMYRGLL